MGDTDQEFTEFVSARLGRLHRLAYRLCGDADRADDFVAQALTALYPRWPRIRTVSDPDAYVRAMVVKAFLSERRRAWSSRVALTGTLPDRAAPATDVEGAAVLRAALDRLPPRQRVVLVLRFLEDLPVAEVARLLDCSPGTVKSQTSAGLASLRRLLGEPAFADIAPIERKG